ncbi:hypothetical protein O6H91_22G037600 [Diphasiastrum complanatum]|uniref:Uncharacterized protein n=1 Tax=Diphasiastrum complanatum TaxID=34168 RepID=A0ACC2AEU7_DIPCM|nr:hypothetical protein O6H91_22G037600 [Diphasiastrum complanatum]
MLRTLLPVPAFLKLFLRQWPLSAERAYTRSYGICVVLPVTMEVVITTTDHSKLKYNQGGGGQIIGHHQLKLRKYLKFRKRLILFIQTKNFGYGCWSPPIEEVPKAMAEIQRTLRETPAGKHIIKLYQSHRKEVIGQALRVT